VTNDDEHTQQAHPGLGPYSWGVWYSEDEHQLPWQRFLDELVEAGCD
jgi:inosose dehydratase